MRVTRFNLVLALGLFLIFGAVGCGSGSGSSSSNSSASVAPTITTAPSAQSVAVGDPVTLTVAASGTAPLSYQWYSGTSSTTVTTPIPGANADFYTPSTASAGTTYYAVAVSNGTGTPATSSPVAVTVNTALVAPTITTYPADQSVVAGNSAILSVVATGSAPLSYQWKVNGFSVGSNSASCNFSSTLAVGSYPVTVTVTNAAGSVTSNVATLTVTARPMAPSITTQPSAQSVTVGDPVTLTVAASGTAPLSYQWYSGTSSTTVTTLIPAANSDFYTPSTALAGTTYYAVTVSNGTGTPATSTPVAVTVNTALVSPAFTTYPADQSVVAGNAASFSVVATGSAPLSYQWKLNGSSVGSNSASYTSSSSLAVGSYPVTVTVTNAAGSVTSNAATLTVTAAPVAPSIATQPSTQSVTVGDPVTLTVAASGTAPLSYQWYSGTSSTTVTTLIPGANADFYTPSTTSAGTTYYAVTVANGTGTPATSSPVAVTVNTALVAPAITTPPGSLTVTEGQPATFTVAATGSATLNYQWQENGVNVGTDSATYTLALPLNSHSGDSITVSVSNAAGSATSTPVTLTVNPLVVTLASSMPLNLTPIAAGTFTMGSPASDPDYVTDETQHQVTISQNFYVGTYLVTQAQWQEVMGSNPSSFTGDLQCPVEQVSYTDITTDWTGFLALLNQNAVVSPAIPTGYVFRLPTEAEWEYACRAGTTTRFYWGDYTDSDTTINNYAWNYSNSGNTTHPVGMLLPNAWGLYDMAGNVWEWCQDLYGSYDSGPDTDPTGPTGGFYRVLRGGSWNGNSNGCRSAYRIKCNPNGRIFNIGFRVVLAPPKTP